jgi:anthranilate synthase component II
MAQALRLLLVDNYDSFTYNLVHYLEALGAELVVLRNDDSELFKMAESCQAIVLSPGPGLPSASGQMPELIRKFTGVKPILGICLGCQALGEHYGAHLENLPQVYHGVQHEMRQVRESKLFSGISNRFLAGRYHSWVVDKGAMTPEMEILVEDEDGRVMAWQHKSEKVHAIQFHPESVMTPDGRQILKNWLEIAQTAAVGHPHIL